MLCQNITQVPNALFDSWLSTFTEGEVKIILVILRQTLGWIDRKTGGRKTRDRITIQQFIRKTGLSKRTITKSLQSLCAKSLVRITDYSGKDLSDPLRRKGKSYIYYATHFTAIASADSAPEPAHNFHHNKRKYKKEIISKESAGIRHISEVIFSKFPKALP